MKYRMVKVESGDSVWFETECRHFFFWWMPCFTHSRGATFGKQYATWEDAAESIHRHKRLHAVEKRTVVRNY